MSTAEATRDVPPENERAEAPQVSRSHRPPSSPGLAAAWLLRATAFAAVAAGVSALIIAPGLRGNASEAVVVAADRAAAALAYFLVALLVALVAWGATELVLRAHNIGVPSRSALVVSSVAAVFLAFPGLFDRLAPGQAVLVATAAIVATLVGAFVSARAPHTRAMSGVLFALAFAAIARLAAWELAMAASERTSVELYGISRALATTGVMLEAVGQLVAVTWLGTRTKLAGQVGATAALIAAYVVTWGVAKGASSEAAPWQSMLHSALGDAAGMPPPYGLDAVATFLVPASLLLACVSAAQPKQVVALVATLALALVSRGAFDAPLRALCAVAAAQWAALAGTDERTMWRALLDDRARRLADDDVSESPRPPGG